MSVSRNNFAAALLSGCALLGAGASADAALNVVGSCSSASTQACVVTDGTFEYLTMGGAKVKSGDLTALLAQGWELGTRADFVGMVQRNAPLFSHDWNDAFLANGSIEFAVSGTELAGHMPQLQLARTGDETIAASFKDIILQLGGFDANPAYTLTVGVAELASGTARRTMGIQALYTDAGTSVTRNNVFDGVQGTGTRSLALEEISASNYFLLRPVTAVPEPQAYALFGVGLCLLGAVKRMRSKHRQR